VCPHLFFFFLLLFLLVFIFFHAKHLTDPSPPPCPEKCDFFFFNALRLEYLSFPHGRLLLNYKKRLVALVLSHFFIDDSSKRSCVDGKSGERKRKNNVDF
jgi:hypothetical protein